MNGRFTPQEYQESIENALLGGHECRIEAFVSQTKSRFEGEILEDVVRGRERRMMSLEAARNHFNGDIHVEDSVEAPEEEIRYA